MLLSWTLTAERMTCKVEAPIDLGGLVGVAENAVGMKSMKSSIIEIESSATQEQLEELKQKVDKHCPLLQTLTNDTKVTLNMSRA